MLLAGHNHHASTHSASDLVTRAGGALVVQAGTATSTRVRDQEQSFNTVDVADAEVTITVNAWRDDRYVPLDAQRYAWEQGHWRIMPTAEPAH
jgi:hypothetical protein